MRMCHLLDKPRSTAPYSETSVTLLLFKSSDADPAAFITFPACSCAVNKRAN